MLQEQEKNLLIDSLYNLIKSGETDKPKIEDRVKGLKFQRTSSYDPLLKVYKQTNFDKLFPTLFCDIIKNLSSSFDPDRAISNFERFSDSIYDKNYLYSILDTNRWLLEAVICLFSGSQYLTDIVLKDPSIFDFLRERDNINNSKKKDQLFREIGKPLAGAKTMEEAGRVIRRFKRQEFLRIGLRDLLNLADVSEIMEEISNVADVSLQSAYTFCEADLIKKFGEPLSTEEGEEGKRIEFCVIGMGKLGGRELNFSSDIDILYVYSSEKGKAGNITSHEYYAKLAAAITKMINELTEHGNVFRVDLNLRPEGSSGDIASSIRSYEIYYESWGQTWERQALIKARTVAGSEALGKRFIDMTRVFVFRKYLDMTAIDDIKGMKDRINKAVAVSRDKKMDLKLGRGGIREIEFIIQVFQIIYGGKDKLIRGESSLSTLKAISERGYISPDDYNALTAAYIFLRRLEHRIQISFAMQTHKLPDGIFDRAVLAKKMGIAGDDNSILAEVLMDSYYSHTENVRRIYDSILSEKSLPEESHVTSITARHDIILFDENGELSLSDYAIARYSFAEEKRLLSNIIRMYKGEDFSHPSAKYKGIFLEILPRILDLCPATPAPLQALNNMEKFISGSASKEILFSLLIENEKVLKLLIQLFGSSDFLTNILITQPDLIDVLFDSKGINMPKSKEDIRKELDALLITTDDNIEILNILRRFKKGEELRIGIRFIIGESDINSTFEDITLLAEVCLDAAVRLSEKKIKALYGTPYAHDTSGDMHESKLVVIGMGKFGGYELDFGSDLDIIFVYGGEGVTEGINDNEDTVIENHYYFSKLCETIIQMITEVTDLGAVYKIDPALRPEGEKGLISISIDGFRNYIKTRGETWEKQALIKARPVAGDIKTGTAFIEMAVKFIYEAGNLIISDMRKMRKRMEEELGKEKGGRRNVKLGYGGLIDIEFITQFFQLKYAATDHSLRVTQTLATLERLKIKGIISYKDEEDLRESYIFYRKILMGMRIENQISKNTIPDNIKTLAKRLGFTDTKDKKAEELFSESYDMHTERTRKIYNRVFQIILPAA